MMHASDMAMRLGLDRYPRSWRGRCPCCDYAGNTFSVRAAEDGGARLYCANGCQLGELVEAVARATGQPSTVRQGDADDAASGSGKRERALALMAGVGTRCRNTRWIATSPHADCQVWPRRMRCGFG